MLHGFGAKVYLREINIDPISGEFFMAQPVTIAISTDFLSVYAKLPKNIQNRTNEFVQKFQNDPSGPGINFERIRGCQDRKLYSVRIDDTYRGIVARQDGTSTYFFLWVDHHDEAYEWAVRRRCAVNHATGAIQIFNVQYTEAAEEEKGEEYEFPLFHAISDTDLIALGVPVELLPFVRSLKTQESFARACCQIPPDAFENLAYLAGGIPLNEVLDMAASQKSDLPVTDDLTAALQNPVTQKSFVIITGEEELRQIMSAPLEKWRVFLHPDQRKIVSKNCSGPVRVLGSAGTGKTVVAMHRAKYLASQLKGEGKILFTTFTTNLVQDIQKNLQKICSYEELKAIEVVNLDRWVHMFLQENGLKEELTYETDEIWREAIERTGNELDQPVSFYEEEWIRIVMAQEAVTLEKYLAASRVGRGIRLDRKKKMMIWKVFEAYRDLLKEKSLYDIHTAMLNAAYFLEKEQGEPRYRHIIVDEGQDFSSNAFRLLRKMAGPEHENDMFIVGDSHQRIYKNRAVLSQCGINVRGRSTILKVNYRTTEETRKFAIALLAGIPFDDLDGAELTEDICRSLTSGMKPEVRNFESFEAEMNFLHQELQALQTAGTPLENICVVAKKRATMEDCRAFLQKKGIKCYKINKESDDRTISGLRTATIHRVKGLEFHYVFIIGVNKNIFPYKLPENQSDPVSIRENIAADKCLLYVALTRAQKGAYITSSGKPSEFLTGFFPD